MRIGAFIGNIVKAAVVRGAVYAFIQWEGHPDNVTNWTWDGRGMPFPFGILDFQFYCPESLELRSGFILDTESLAADALEKYGLESDSSTRTGRHRPLIAEYGWK